MNSYPINRYIISCYLTFIILFSSSVGFAQQVPLASGFFTDKYLQNSAKYGISAENSLLLGIRNNVANNHANQNEQLLNLNLNRNTHGFGAGIHNINSGSFKHTSLQASYAHHLLFDNPGHMLSLGTSLSYTSENIDLKKIEGETNDPTLLDFNRRTNKLDLDLGVAYSVSDVDIQLSVNNILAKKTTYFLVNKNRIFSSVSYTIETASRLRFSPQVSYRKLLNDNDVLDLGGAVAFNPNFQLFALYHSNQNITTGLNLNIKKFKFNAAYLKGTSGIQRNTAECLEFAVGYRW